MSLCIPRPRRSDATPLLHLFSLQPLPCHPSSPDSPGNSQSPTPSTRSPALPRSHTRASPRIPNRLDTLAHLCLVDALLLLDHVHPLPPRTPCVAVRIKTNKIRGLRMHFPFPFREEVSRAWFVGNIMVGSAGSCRRRLVLAAFLLALLVARESDLQSLLFERYFPKGRAL